MRRACRFHLAQVSGGRGGSFLVLFRSFFGSFFLSCFVFVFLASLAEKGCQNGAQMGPKCHKKRLETNFFLKNTAFPQTLGFPIRNGYFLAQLRHEIVVFCSFFALFLKFFFEALLCPFFGRKKIDLVPCWLPTWLPGSTCSGLFSCLSGALWGLGA